jgi:hypothetical protein
MAHEKVGGQGYGHHVSETLKGDARGARKMEGNVVETSPCMIWTRYVYEQVADH